MAISYERTGRVGQKARTRAALIAAARDLLATGITPTVEQAAAAASIARATAYRYFPNQRSLLLGAHPEIEEPSLLGHEQSEDPEVRLGAVVDEILRMTLETEPELRAMLRLSLEPQPPPAEDLPLRTGRRVLWVRDALAPLEGRMADAELERLVHAIAAVAGIDSLVWMTDVAGLSRQEAVELMRWSARALLRSGLAELPAR